MLEQSKYTKCLSLAFQKALELSGSADPDEAVRVYVAQKPLRHPLKQSSNGRVSLLGKTVAEGLTTIVKNFSRNKYLYSILITALVEKIVHPHQDIRYAKAELRGGYSNRTTDQVHVTPFLKRNNLTACAASGMESGRNIERPFPLTLEFATSPKGSGNREAFLGVLHAVQEESIVPFPCIVLLMALDLQTRQKAVYEYPQPTGLTIQEIIDAILSHHQTALGNGRARLPVLAVQAVYQCLIPETSRYKHKVLRNPPNRHTGNDKKGWIGDIQVDRLDGTPFEAVEVKAGRSITSDMVMALTGKFRGMPVDRYLILSTKSEYVLEKERPEIEEAVKRILHQTGCEVIVNGLNRSLWYYLRLLSTPSQFLHYYTEQLQNDLDAKDAHRTLWMQILNSIDN